MKKIFLTFVLLLSFALTFGAEEVTLNGCGANASAISSSCCSGCVSVVPALTGSLDVNINSGPRKPTKAEFQVAQAMLDDYCSS